MAAIGPRTVAAILVAAGSGERLAASVPKAFVTVGGRTLLEHAAGRFTAHPDIVRTVVVAPRARVDEAAALTGLHVVAGGDTRQASVLAGLAALDDGHGGDNSDIGASGHRADRGHRAVDAVLVHDVARPFVPAAVISAVVAALCAGADAAIPVVGIHDTVRRVDAAGAFVEIVDRASLVAVQTPQGFDRAVLDAAHRAGTALTVTDDAALVEALGYTVVAVPGADESFKITRPWDLAVAEAVAGA